MSTRVPKYVVLHKKRGETPLEALQTWRDAHPEWKDLPASYAGRLDPMAEGKLLVLLGDECKKQGQYTKLDKEYEIEVLLDLKTDTGDVLGAAEYAGKKTELPTGPTGQGRGALRRALQTALRIELGTHLRAYPVFSSKTVQGKPLFLYALEGTLNEIEIPQHEETVYRIKLLDVRALSTNELKSRIDESLAVVPRSDEPSKALGADFRQDAIRACWNALLQEISAREFVLLNLRVACGSGTYMRTLAERIGASLGTTAFALSINRTRLGSYRRIGSFDFWTEL